MRRRLFVSLHEKRGYEYGPAQVMHGMTGDIERSDWRRSAATSVMISITIALAARFKLSFHDIYSLRSFVALGDFKFDVLAFVQSLESIPLNGAIVNEYIATALFLSINPYPFELLNHLTFPVAISKPPASRIP